jgi:2-C-methyl-D-erythritol 4-phosphate cytidylyltransferase
VVAAGSGTRFGSETPKQFHSVGGVPIVLWALRHFTSHPDVGHVVLVLRASDATNPPSFLLQAGFSGASAGNASPSSASSSVALTLVPGGAHRGDSVRAGITALRVECSVVLVHDGARPFVDRTVIDAVIDYARKGEGAVPAVPLSDTLKEVDRRDPSRILRTHPRTQMWRAQTPQGFPRAVLEQAYARAARVGRRATDDAALVEAMGTPVRLVPDSRRNIKVTTPEDLALAELLAGALG